MKLGDISRLISGGEKVVGLNILTKKAANSFNKKVSALITAMLGTLLFAGAAFAAHPTDTRTNVVGTTYGSNIQIIFTPTNNATQKYAVYRHDKDDLRKFVLESSAVVQTTGGTPVIQGTPAGWSTDQYGYVIYTDAANDATPITDYEEYYYLVAEYAQTATPAAEETQVDLYTVVGAFPPAQTRHGSYSEYTNACTACHGLHSSVSTLSGLGKLLKAATQTDLCVTCHDGSGSKYDEINGIVRTGATWGSYTTAAAGPFGSQFGNPNTTIGGDATSVHNVYRIGLTLGAGAASGSVGSNAAYVWSAPGSTNLTDPKNGGSTANDALTCATCHEPHNKFKNYRLLRGDILTSGDYGMSVADRTGVKVRGVAEIDLNTPNSKMLSKYLSATASGSKGVTAFCTACHREFTTTDDGTTQTQVPPNDGTWGHKRHMMEMTADRVVTQGGGRFNIDPLGSSTNQARVMDVEAAGRDAAAQKYVPLEGTQTTYNGNKVVCITCHVPHGTRSTHKVEVAYANGNLNGTYDATDPSYTRRLNDAYLINGDNNSDNVYDRFDAAGDALRGSTALGRFQPFASACYRCHSTK